MGTHSSSVVMVCYNVIGFLIWGVCPLLVISACVELSSLSCRTAMAEVCLIFGFLLTSHRANISSHISLFQRSITLLYFELTQGCSHLPLQSKWQSAFNRWSRTFSSLLCNPEDNLGSCLGIGIGVVQSTFLVSSYVTLCTCLEACTSAVLVHQHRFQA